MTVINKHETRSQAGTWRSALTPLAIAVVYVVSFVVGAWANDAQTSWVERFSNDCGRLVVFPWTMTAPLDAALALSALGIATTATWFIWKRRAGDRKGLTIFTAIVLACAGALLVALTLFNMNDYANFRVTCTGP